MDVGKSLEDLNLTNDELKRLTEAFKNKDFRNLLVEYAEEISDPENKKRYEEEIRALEAERGKDVRFVHPEEGYVIKTTINGTTKAFINICKNKEIEEPSVNRKSGPNGRPGMQWTIPHSFAPPRDDYDKARNPCKVFDVVFHPHTYRMSETNQQFKKMLHDTAFDGIEKQFSVSIDRKNLKFPSMKFKGTPTATVIRSNSNKPPPGNVDQHIIDQMPNPYGDLTSKEKYEENARKHENSKPATDVQTTTDTHGADEDFTEPKYTVVHRSDLDIQQYRDAPDAGPNSRPKELVITIDLPLLKSTVSVDLDVFEKKLSLVSVKPAKYKLCLDLPYPVLEDEGSAKFDKSKRQLVVTLPVVQVESNENLETSTSESAMIEAINVSADHCDDDDNEKLDNDENEKLDCSLIEEISFPQSGDAEQEIAKTEIKQLNENGVRTSDNMKYTLPEFIINQMDKYLSLIVEVKNVAEDSIVKSFPVTEDGFNIKFKSLGSGNFPIFYSLNVVFSPDCHIVPDDTLTDLSPENLVIIFKKKKQSMVEWHSYFAGLDGESMQERMFVTALNEIRELDALDAELGTRTDTTAMPAHKHRETTADDDVTAIDMQVTEMTKDKLTINIKTGNGSARGRHVSDSSDDPQQTPSPRLHGILKQRSRTFSEDSSDDIGSPLSGSLNASNGHLYLRENSRMSTSESIISESEELDGEMRKKSVSFSGHDDRFMYMQSKSITSMASSKKNHQKKQKKREQKIQERRRRRTSGGSLSSGDELSSGSATSGDSNVVVNDKDTDDDADDLHDDDVIAKPAEASDISGDASKAADDTKTTHNAGGAVNNTGKRKRNKKRNRNKNKQSGGADGAGEQHGGGKGGDKSGEVQHGDDECSTDGGEKPLDSDDCDEPETYDTSTRQTSQDPVKSSAMLNWHEGVTPDGDKPNSAVELTNDLLYEMDDD